MFNLAIKNIMKNKIRVSIYFLSLCTSSILFYTFTNFFLNNMELLKESRPQFSNTYTLILMSLLLSIPFFILTLYLTTYAAKNYMMKRYNELAIYRLHGLDKFNLFKLFLFENFILFTLSIIIGIVIGYCNSILISNSFKEVFTILGLEIDNSLNIYALIIMIILFLIIYLSNTIFVYVFVIKKSIIELIKYQDTNEKKLEFKSIDSIFLIISNLILLMASIIVTMYLPVINGYSANKTIMIIIILFLVGFYSFFTFFKYFTSFIIFILSKSFKFKSFNNFSYSLIFKRISTNMISYSLISMLFAISIASILSGNIFIDEGANNVIQSDYGYGGGTSISNVNTELSIESEEYITMSGQKYEGYDLSYNEAILSVSSQKTVQEVNNFLNSIDESLDVEVLYTDEEDGISTSLYVDSQYAYDNLYTSESVFNEIINTSKEYVLVDSMAYFTKESMYSLISESTYNDYIETFTDGETIDLDDNEYYTVDKITELEDKEFIKADNMYGLQRNIVVSDDAYKEYAPETAEVYGSSNIYFNSDDISKYPNSISSAFESRIDQIRRSIEASVFSLTFGTFIGITLFMVLLIVLIVQITNDSEVNKSEFKKLYKIGVNKKVIDHQINIVTYSYCIYPIVFTLPTYLIGMNFILSANLVSNDLSGIIMFTLNSGYFYMLILIYIVFSIVANLTYKKIVSKEIYD